MTQKAQALVLAEPDASLRTALEVACQDAGYELVLEPSAEVATSKLSAKRFDALVLDMTTPGAALVCLKARGKLVRARIPVITLVEEEDEVGFARAYRAGADEVLLLGRPAALTARLRSLPKSGIPQPGQSRGDAVVADADRARAEVLERVLRDAGFRVELAVDGFAARLQVGRPSLKVAVLDASLDDAAALINQARTRGARCAWIVRGRPDGIEELRSALGKLDRVALVNAYGPPDDVLFEANRLLEPRQSDGRADQRQLYGTIVRLKWEGQPDADIGYAYNVSSVGLFIRTLAAPAASTVELELLPPGLDTMVRLKGDVIWRREFGTTRREPVPAGFGVKITGGEVDTWAKACPRALSLPPRSILPAIDEARVQPKVEIASAPVEAASLADMAQPGPKRSSSTDKLRLPERLRAPVGSAFSALAKPRKDPSPVPPNVAPDGAKSPTVQKVAGGREPQSSVEEMLLSVLSGSPSGEDALGAAPLSIDGGEVVELDKPSDTARSAGSDEPPPPSVEPVPPSAESPTIEVHRGLSATPPRAEPRKADSDAPSIEVHGGGSVVPRTERSSDGPTIEVARSPDSVKAPAPPAKEAASAPEAPKALAGAAQASDPPAARPSDPPELADALLIEPLPSSRPPPPNAAPPITSSAPRSLEVASRDLVPDELQKLAAAGKTPGGAVPTTELPVASDPLAATVRAETSPIPPEALPEYLRPKPKPAPEAPAAVPSQVPPSASTIEQEGEIQIPQNRPGYLWIVGFAVAAGVASFFAFPAIRNLVAPTPAARAPAISPTTTVVATNAATTSAVTAPAASAEAPTTEVPTASAVEPTAQAASAEASPVASAAPSATAPAGTAAALAPASGEAPDDAVLASLEKGTGFLFVASPLQTNVYLYGILAGPTNQRLVSKCGARFIRLGTAPGAWQSDGLVTVVKCGGFTRVQIAP